MKKKFAIFLALPILILIWCLCTGPAVAFRPEKTAAPPTFQTDPGKQETCSVFSDPVPDFTNPESVSQEETEPATEYDDSAAVNPAEETVTEYDDSAAVNPAEETVTEPSTEAAASPPETLPPAVMPQGTQPKETDPCTTELPTDVPAETTPEPEETTPAVTEITHEFKRQVAACAARYINQYRGSACTVLPGMSQVAQYRAGQLTENFSHSTADKRAALAHYEYGRYVDATQFGDDPSNSYWEADSAEAICAGFYGADAEDMGRRIADMIRNSPGHWSYIGSSSYSYIGVGVEYKAGTQYGWYCCVMVGSVDYG